MYSILPLIGFGLNVLLLSLVIRQRPRTFSHRLFIFFLIGMGIWTLATFGMRTSDTLGSALVWEKVISAALPIVSVSFLHFVGVLTGVRNRRLVLIAAYFCMVIAITLAPTNLTVSGMRQMWYGHGLIGGPLLVPNMAIFYIFVSIALLWLVVAFKKAESSIEKSRYEYIFLGGFVCLFGLLIDVLAATGSVRIYPLGILTNIIFSLLASYALLKYRLLDFRIVIRRGAVYAIVSGIAFGLGMSIISIVYLFGVKEWQLANWASVAIIVILGIVLQPVLNFSHRSVDKWFNRHKIDYMLVLENLSKEVKTITDLNYVATSLVNSIAATMQCKSVVLLVPDVEEKCFVPVATRGDIGTAPHKLDMNSVLVWYLETHEEIIKRSDLDLKPHFKALNRKDRDNLQSLNTELVVPIADKAALRGILILGQKLSDQDYFPDEIMMLQILGRQMATTLDNARLYNLQIRRYRAQELLAKVSTHISSEFNEENIYQHCSAELKKIMQNDYFGINLKQEKGNLATVFTDMVPEVAPFAGDIDKNLSLVDIVALSQAPYYRPDLAYDRKSGLDEIFHTAGIRTLLLLPLVAKGAAFGSLAIGSPTPDAYDKEDIELLKQVAIELAIGIEKSRLYEAEKKARLELEKKDRERTDLVNALVHEINTPLTAILASSELLREELENKGTIGALAKNLDVAARNLGNRITELMDYSKIQTTSSALHPESLDFYNLVRSLAAQVVPLLKSRDQTLQVNLPELTVMVTADRDRVTQILLNLLNNAIKFSGLAQTISISSYTEDTNVVIAVRDAAPPISPEEMSSLFQPYHRLSRGKGSGGLGLGLSICKRLVELHGGKIWVEPGNSGNTFKFSLPIHLQTEVDHESTANRR